MSDLFETTDVEVARRVLCRLYRVRRFSASGEHPFLRVRRNRLGPLELHHLTLTMDCDVLLNPSGRLCLGHVIDGAMTVRQRGERLEWKTGDVFLASQPDAACRVEVRDADVEFVVFDPALLARVADVDPARSAEPIRFTGYAPATPEAGELWLDTYKYVRDAVGMLPPAGRPLLLGGIARLLAATALATFPNTALQDPAFEQSEEHPVSLQRALVYIEANAHRDINSTDIAGAAEVTLRTLQLAFRRHLDSTPSAHLRRVRLDRVHGALRVADPDRTTVMAVASRWGFINHSRFTAFYHATYGITPSHTLRYI